MRVLCPIIACLAILCLFGGAAAALDSWGYVDTIGSGADEVTVLYAGGTPYDIGYWHGSLLRNQVQASTAFMLAMARAEVGQQALLEAWAAMAPFVSQEFHDELQGLADGSGVPLSDLHEVHAIPDVSEYHCSAFNAFGSATANGHMLQMRILDWSMDMGVQDHPLLIVAQPVGGHQYTNITFAGFIGSIAGISSQGIGVSEMGDDFDYAYETLSGIPMPFLLRDVIAHATSYAEAEAMVQNAIRTSSLWYVIGDADAPDAGLFQTSPVTCNIWRPGQMFEPYQPLPDVCWVGHYMDRLYADLSANWGAMTVDSAIAITRHNAMSSNLLDAVYDLTTREVWVAYADGALPASGQTFSHLDTTKPAGAFADTFDDPNYTNANWFQFGQKFTPKTVDGRSLLELQAAVDPTNTLTEATCLAAGARAGFVDGLTMATDICLLSGQGGLAFGGQGLVGGASTISYRTYVIQVDPAADTLALAGEGEGLLGAASVPLEYGQWYRVQLVSTLTTFEVWFAPEGQALAKVIEVPQDVLHPGTQTFTVGGVGLYAENVPTSTVRFDNFSVAGVPDNVHYLACPTVRALREQPAVVPVWLNHAEGVASAQFDLHYDPNILTGLAGPQVEKGALVAADPNWVLSWYPVAPGQVHVTLTNTAGLGLGDGAGELVRLTFTVNGAAAPRSACLLDLQAPAFTDALGTALPAACWDGAARVARMAESLEVDAVASPQCAANAFTVTARARDEYGDVPAAYAATANLTDLTGTAAPASVVFGGGTFSGNVTVATAHAADVITLSEAGDATVTGSSPAFQVLARGDVDGDGAITDTDVAAAANIAVGLTSVSGPVFAAADYNRDGAVNCRDIISIQNVAQGRAFARAAVLGETMIAAQAAAKGGIAPTAIGDTIAVPITVNKGTGVTAFNCDLAYNAGLVTPTGVRKAGLLAAKADWVVVSNLTAGSPVKILAYSNISAPLTTNSKGTLVEVLFTQNGSTYGTFSLSNKLVSDRYGATLGRTLGLGTVYVVR